MVAVLVGVLVGAVLGWVAAGRVLRAGAAPELSSALAAARSRVTALEEERQRSEALWRERAELGERRLQ